MARTLQQPRIQEHNIRVYDNDGALLASMHVRPDVSLYVTNSMLYRYCSIAFLVSGEEKWGIYPLLDNGSPGHILRDGRETAVRPGNYLVLSQPTKNPVAVQINPENPPRRVLTRDRDTQSQSEARSERSHLQRVFRDNLLTRDEVCTITQDITAFPGDPNNRLVQAAHIIPTSQISLWNRHYRRYVADQPAGQSGESRMYSPRNGLLLGLIEHTLFDDYRLGVDPAVDYKVIFFGNDGHGLGGRRLKHSAIHGANNIPGVHPRFLQWHLRMCVLANMRASAEPLELWENDLGEDDIG